MKNCKDYTDCVFYKAVETDYDVTNGHSSYREYCTKTGEDKRIIGFINCKKCAQDVDKHHKMLEITKMMTISTAHITEETANRLNRDPNDNNLGICVYPKSEYGWYIPIDKELINVKGLPEDLVKVMKFAASMDCQTLCLDCDANICEELPIFDW